MKIKLALLISLQLYLFCSDSLSQGITNPHLNVGHGNPSPAVNGLMSINTSVNHSTGAANISIPITVLSSHTLTVPVSLSYQSSGIKVEERASWVGLGWNLNAGGIISRKVNGKPDETLSNLTAFDLQFGEFGDHLYGMPNGGYLSNSQLIPSTFDANNTEHSDYARRTLHGNLDLEPDEFYFNFMGYSGTFILDANGNPTIIPFQSLKIERIDLLNGFKITDDQGYEYFFTFIEKTKTTNSCTSSDYYDITGTISGWFLTEIRNVNNQVEFTFHYEENEDESITTNHFQIKKDYACSQSNDVNCPGFEFPQVCTVTNRYKITHLSRITSVNGEVVFIKGEERLDLYNDYVLKEIQLKNSQDEGISVTKFSYDYFNSSSTLRLKLHQIHSLNTSGISENPLIFEYSDKMLPEYYSTARDHWGYYNGNVTPIYLEMSNTSKHANPAFTGACMLKKIISPTGAVTSFEFETNTYGSNEYGSVQVGSNVVAEINSMSAAPSPWVLLEDFTLETLKDVNLSYSLQNSTNCSAITLIIENQLGELFFSTNAQTTSTVSITLTLPAGTYTLKATGGSDCSGSSTTSGSIYASVKATPYYSINSKTFCGGGMRIKSIATQERPNAEISKKEYSYRNFNDPERSSGYLFTTPKYSYYQDYWWTNYRANGCGIFGNSFCSNCNPGTNDYEVQGQYGTSHFFSSSYIPLQQASGAFIIYENVTESVTCLNDPSCENGRIEYEFSLFPITGNTYFIQPPSTYKRWRSGNLIRSKIYSSSGQILSESTFEYSSLPSGTIRGLKAGDVQFNLYKSTLNPICKVRWVVDAIAYVYENEKFFLASRTDKTYDQNNTNKSYSIQTLYTYDTALRLIETENNHLESGHSQKQKVRYANAYSPGCTTCSNDQAEAVQFMLNSNNRVWHVPIEAVSLVKKDGQYYVTSGIISEFELVNGKLVQSGSSILELSNPESESTFQWSSIVNGSFTQHPAYRRTSFILSFDQDLRPTAMRTGYGPVECKIRDYSDGRVVASIANASPNQCAYTSFENNEINGWNFSYIDCVSELYTHLDFNLPRAYSGNKSYKFSSGNITSTNMPAGKYKLIFWSLSSNAFTATVSNGATIQTIHSNVSNNNPYWKYNEFIIQSNSTFSITINGGNGNYIDELRLHPVDAQMTTQCYNSDGTVLTSCDVNSTSRYFLYDSWKRIEWTLDESLHILSFNEYKTKEQMNNSDYSWMKSRLVLTEGWTKNQILNAPLSNLNIASTITYQDALGRTVQTIAVRQSPMKRDMVQFKEYDGISREKFNYLPFTIGGSNNGAFIGDPETALMNFYSMSPRVAHTSYPFAEVSFEDSPLSRVVEKGNVGESWQINSGATTKFQYQLNDVQEILDWRITSDGASALNQGSASYFSENALVKNLVINENGQRMWQYANALGQVVCTRVEAAMTGSGGSSYSWYNGFGHFDDWEMEYLPGLAPTSRFLDTYFVYDDFGRLVYKIPSIAISQMNGNYEFSQLSNGVHFSLFTGYITKNTYDQRGRVIESKKPGETTTRYLYNNLNEVIALQKPTSAETLNEWHFIKYDVMGRPIQTGLLTTSLSRQQLQEQRDLETNNLWEQKTGISSSPYTNVSYPTTFNVLLSENYFDNYQFALNGFTNMGNSQQSRSVIGKPTGEKLLVLDNSMNQYLLNVYYYNRSGLLDVQFGSNILGGFERTEYTYDYNGRVTQTAKISNVFGGIGIKKRFEYDHAGRLIASYHKIGNDDEVTLSKLNYNELGQLVKKHLHLTSQSTSGMQVIDYRYNERGWLTKINNADLVDDGDNQESWDIFGEEIIYHDQSRLLSDRMEMISQYDGKIAAIKWKTNRNPEFGGDEMPGHSYVYRYDDLGQMVGAFYAASSETYIDFYNKRCNMWDETVAYDANGNIVNLTRSRGIDENGDELTAPMVMDRLSFTYETNSNKIIAVNDFGQEDWISNERYSHFINGTTENEEYFYDDRGRLIEDRNKGLEQIEYNVLNNIQRVQNGSEDVVFVWDASGNKLSKTAGAITTYYIDGIEYVNNQIQSISTSEGIARCPNCMLSGGDWKYDYYLTDHLGNIRAVITEEESELIRDRVTVELDKREIEDANFENVSETEKDKPYLYPYDPTDPFNLKVSELSSFTGKVMGPAKVIEVKQGEKIDLSTQYWYNELPGDPLSNISEILAGTLLNLGSASTGVIPSGPEMGMALLNNVNGDQYSVFSNFINNAFDQVDFSKPQAYLVYMTFDKNMQLDVLNSGVMQVGNSNELALLMREGINPRKDGYFYTYVTNKSEGKVNFNNLEIVRWAPKIRAVYDYYPFGLTWENPTIPNDPNAVHDRTAQGKELQFSEFSGGRGLALLDFHARMYDPALGRWSIPDPAYQFSNPYLAMGNNPVIGVDPDGRFVNEFFDALEYVSPIVFRPNIHVGSEQRGLGFDISIGIPKLVPISVRWEFGRTYFWRNFDNPSGWETRRGGEMTYLWVFSMTGTKYESGETSQKTTMFTIGVPYFNVKYENDYQPKFVHKITPRWMNMHDNGDRYRSAAMKIQIGWYSIGFNLFTGDPGLDANKRPYQTIDGHETYVREEGTDPDKYRAGVAYVGWGPLRMGLSSEKIRHVIQNRFAHDFLTRGEAKWFRRLPEEEDKFFIYFGTGSNSTW